MRPDTFTVEGRDTMDRRRLATRIAAISLVGDAAFGVAVPIAMSHLARTGELPMTPWGFRAFDSHLLRPGQDRFAALMLMLEGVCILDVVAGVWLWQGRRRGAVLGLAMTPSALALGAGFELPFLLGPAVVRSGLLAYGWRSLEA